MPASYKTTASEKLKSGRLIWNTELRLALMLLKEEFHCTDTKAARTLSLLFKDHFRSCGVTEPNPGSISSQYTEKTNDKAWKRWGPAVRASSEQRQAMKARIDAVIHGSAVSGDTQDHIRSFLYQPDAAGVIRVTKRNDHTTRRSPRTPKPVVAVQGDESEAFMQDLTSNTSSTSPRTPRRKQAPNPTPRVPLITLNGRTLMITPEKHRISKLPLVPVASATAHPPVSLLFRYWCDEETQSPLTTNGFKAKMFAYSLLQPRPAPRVNSRNFPWESFELHLRNVSVASPFISTSNNFPWVVRLAWKYAKAGKRGHISVIDPSALDPQSIFHAQPFQRELCKKYVFEEGAWLYQGMHEFLVWAKIPKEAVTFTFPFQALIELASTDAAVGQIFRLEQLGSRRGFLKKILPEFRRQGLALTARNIAGLASLCRTLRIPVTKPHAISCLVGDVIQAFALKLERHSMAEWAQPATIFANALCNSSTPRVDWENTRWAFLDACSWATGEPNARQKPKHMSKMLRRSAKIGLESPGEILMHEIEQSRRSVEALEKGRWELTRGAMERGFLVEDARRVEEQVDEMEIDEMEVDIDDNGVNDEHAGIVYERDEEEDGDGDYDDDGSVFEL